MTDTRFNRTTGALAYSPRTVSSSGLVEIALDIASDGALLVLDDGITLRGIKITDNSGTDKTSTSSYHAFSVYVTAAAGDTGTIGHQDSAVSDAYKIRVARTDANLSIGGDQLVKLVYAPGEARWVAYEIGAAPPSDAYTAGTASHWAGSAPTTQADAIDRLAAWMNGAVIALLGGGKP